MREKNKNILRNNFYFLLNQKHFLLIAVMFSQFLSALFFSFDIFVDVILETHNFTLEQIIYYFFEFFATVSLWFGGLFIFLKLGDFLKKIEQLQLSLKKTSNQLFKEIAKTFEKWNLSPSEKDVALLIIKGFNNFEIANIRKRNEGTVKSQTSKIYEKANVRNRSEFIASIIEEFTELIDSNHGL